MDKQENQGEIVLDRVEVEINETPVFRTEESVPIQDYILRTAIDQGGGFIAGLILTILGLWFLFKQLGVKDAAVYLKRILDKQVEDTQSITKDMSNVKSTVDVLKEKAEDVEEKIRDNYMEIRDIKSSMFRLENKLDK